jgi:hypothetical protein
VSTQKEEESRERLQKADGNVGCRIDEPDNPLVAGACSMVRACRGIVRDTKDNIECKIGTIGPYKSELLRIEVNEKTVVCLPV